MTKRVFISALASLVLASTLATAQAPSTPVNSPTTPPALSDVEKTTIDVLALIAQRDAALKDLGTCTASLAPLQAQARETQLRSKVEALRQKIRSAHPGYDWDLEQGTLVPIAPKAAQGKAP